jgi:hypothetical protein
MFAGSVSIGSHHLENEGGAEAAQKAPAKIIVIQPADHVMLVGGKRSLWASICDADGENCKDAKKAKWSVKPRKGLKLGPKKGAQSIAEGARPGLYTVTVKQNGIAGTMTVTINEPPDRSGAKASGDELRLFVEPEGFVVGVGGEARFVTWGCPLENGTGTGANGVADGLDDACTTVPTEAVNIDAGAPLSQRALLGPTVVLRFDAFPADEAGELTFLGAHLVTPIGGTLPSLQGRDEPETDPFFYDMNMDGVVDSADRDILTGGLPGDGSVISPSDPGFDQALDLTGDHLLDANDAELFDSLAPAIPAEVDTGPVAEATEDPFEAMLRELDDDFISGIEAGLLTETMLAREPADPGSGDVDRSGELDVTDMLLVRGMANVNKRLTPAEPPLYDAAADADGDGDVDDMDLALIIDIVAAPSAVAD